MGGGHTAVEIQILSLAHELKASRHVIVRVCVLCASVTLVLRYGSHLFSKVEDVFAWSLSVIC